MLGCRGNQIVALTKRELKKGFGHNTAHRMAAEISVICVALSVPVPASHGVARAIVKRLA